MDVARRNGIAIDAPCAGNGSCGKCKIKLLEGKLDTAKTRHISDSDYADGIRLACASKPDEDVVVEIPDTALAYKNDMKIADINSDDQMKIFDSINESLLAAGIERKNDARIISLELDIPTLDDTMPDYERVSRAIQAKLEETGWYDEFNVTDKTVHFGYALLCSMPTLLRRNNFKADVVIAKKNGTAFAFNMTKLGKNKFCPGLAIDIGTTSVSAILVDMITGKVLAKASSGNGQIEYGADVINRIIESTREGGLLRLKKAVTDDTIIPLTSVMCSKLGISPDDIIRCVIASNTTMNHLFAGIDAANIRLEPYIPAFFDIAPINARDLSLSICSDADVFFAPNIGSYVGGDITAGTLASLIWNNPEYSVFIDLGTNGEIVFGNEELLMSCACSAGPAFEGGDISCGMRATTGAIEEVSIDIETSEPSFKTIGDEKPVGICGSGLIDTIANLFRCKIISPKGQFVKECRRVLVDEHGSSRYVLAFANESGTGKEISINEPDIDNFIRAKGAIYSGIKTVIESIGFDMSMISNVCIAGGIGSGIDFDNAVEIGMLPDIERNKFRFIGNTSLTGAYSMLVSNNARDKVEELAKTITYVELSTYPTYMDDFVAACFLPHTDASLFPSVF